MGLAADSAHAQSAQPGYRALVPVFLYGGNDGWNMIAPRDSRYRAYAEGRGAGLALPQDRLVGLDGANFGLHPALSRLNALWNRGALAFVVNTGALVQPMDRALYQARPDFRPANLFAHAHAQLHWEGLRMQSVHRDGVFGRMHDRLPPTATASLYSLAGSRLALLGAKTSPLVLSPEGEFIRSGFDPHSSDPAIRARQAAIAAFAAGAQDGGLTARTNQDMQRAYAQAQRANAAVAQPLSGVDAHFRTAAGAPLRSSIARQLLRIAHVIAAHDRLGQSRQILFAAQGGYDTHEDQTAPGDPTAGTHARLLRDLAEAVRAFADAMATLGLAEDVTLFTMSEFGRTYRATTARGTDHGWGNVHFAVGAGLAPRRIHGAYPKIALGGVQDMAEDGRWIPTIAIEEYLAPLALWFGIAPADLAYVFPAWSTWSGGGRGPAPLMRDRG